MGPTYITNHTHWLSNAFLTGTRFASPKLRWNHYPNDRCVLFFSHFCRLKFFSLMSAFALHRSFDGIAAASVWNQITKRAATEMYSCYLALIYGHLIAPCSCSIRKRSIKYELCYHSCYAVEQSEHQDWKHEQHSASLQYKQSRWHQYTFCWFRTLLLQHFIWFAAPDVMAKSA